MAGCAALVVLVEQIAVAPVLRRSMTSISWVISTLAFSIIVQNVVAEIWGGSPRSVELPLGLSSNTVSPRSSIASRFRHALGASSRYKPGDADQIAIARALKDEDDDHRGVINLDEPTAALPTCKPIGEHQAIRFALAQMQTDVTASRVFLDR